VRERRQAGRVIVSETREDGDDVVAEDAMRAAMQAYIDRFNAGDGEGLAALFADDAQIEDPVGGPRMVRGRAEIDAFYSRAVGVVERLVLAAPIRASHGSAAAMAFDIHIRADRRIIRVIDVMQFNEAGEIVDMKAYHGPGDVEVP
jgi:steroid Delta-isomerase